MPRVLNAVQRVLQVLILVLGLCSVVLVIGVLGFHLKPLVVISDSMRPAFSYGALVISRQEPANQAKPGDIVSVPRPEFDQVITHRVVSNECGSEGQCTLVLKGDANPQDDPKPYVVDQVALYKFHIAGVGRAVLWVQDHPWITGIVLLVLLGFSFLRPITVSVRGPNGELITGLTRKQAREILETRAKDIPVSSGAARYGVADDSEPTPEFSVGPSEVRES
jgi:signal peptidase